MNSVEMNSRPDPAVSEDPRVTRALEEYLAALEAGRRPERHEFLARHADIVDALTGCLAGLELMHAATRTSGEI